MCKVQSICTCSLGLRQDLSNYGFTVLCLQLNIWTYISGTPYAYVKILLCSFLHQVCLCLKNIFAITPQQLGKTKLVHQLTSIKDCQFRAKEESRRVCIEFTQVNLTCQDRHLNLRQVQWNKTHSHKCCENPP